MKVFRNFTNIFFAIGLSCTTLSAQFFFPSYDESDCYCIDSQTKDKFILYGEALYWTAREENLLFATDSLINLSSTTFDTTSIQINNVNIRTTDFRHKWTPGFRIGAGYETCDQWETYLVWTHFHNHACRHQSGFPGTGSSGQFVNPTGLTSSDFVTPYATAASSVVNLCGRWSLNFDTIDWVFGKDFSFCNCFNFTPFFGFKFDRIEQKVCYVGSTNTPIELIFENIGLKTLYEGGGITTGVNSNWDLGCGIQLNGNFGFGWTYGYMRSKSRSFLIDESFGFRTIFVTENRFLNHSEHLSRVNLDFGIGISGEYPIFECVNLIFNVGYEYHQYFSQNFFGYDSSNRPLRGDLIMHGGVFGVGLEF